MIIISKAVKIIFWLIIWNIFCVKFCFVFHLFSLYLLHLHAQCLFLIDDSLCSDVNWLMIAIVSFTLRLCVQMNCHQLQLLQCGHERTWKSLKILWKTIMSRFWKSARVTLWRYVHCPFRVACCFVSVHFIYQFTFCSCQHLAVLFVHSHSAAGMPVMSEVATSIRLLWLKQLHNCSLNVASGEPHLVPDH